MSSNPVEVQIGYEVPTLEHGQFYIMDSGTFITAKQNCKFRKYYHYYDADLYNYQYLVSAAPGDNIMNITDNIGIIIFVDE